MTTETHKVIVELTQKGVQFDLTETMKVLLSSKNTFMSWGTSQRININDSKGLCLKVNGMHHKGYVLISLSGNDTYTVHIVSTHGNVMNEYTDVYVENLVSIIDNRIERIKEYVR